MTQTINIINGGEVTIDIKDITMFNYAGGLDNIIVGNNAYPVTPATANKLKMIADTEENKKTYYFIDDELNLKIYWGSYLFIDNAGNRMLQINNTGTAMSADYITRGTSEDPNDVYDVLKSKINKIKSKGQRRIAYWEANKAKLDLIPAASELPNYTFTIGSTTYNGADIYHIEKKRTHYELTINNRIIKAPNNSKIAFDITNWLNEPDAKPLWYPMASGLGKPLQRSYSFFSCGVYYHVCYNRGGVIVINHNIEGASHDKEASRKNGSIDSDRRIEEIVREHVLLDRKLEAVKRYINNRYNKTV